MKEEEQVYVLAGSMEVRIGKEWHHVGAGAYIHFPAGLASEHKFRNRGDAPCRFFLIGERKRDDVIVYPDVDQVAVRLMGKRFGHPVEPREIETDD